MKKSRQLIIFAIIIVVVIGVSATAAILWSNYKTSQSNQSPGNKQNGDQSATLQESPAEKTSDDADKIAYSGDVKGGVQKLDDAIKNTTDNQELFTYYSRKATLLLNNNNLPDALTAAKKAYDINSTSESGALVGQIAQQMGDKATAIDYYQKAIDHIDPTDPYAKSDKTYYQSIITGLQGGN